MDPLQKLASPLKIVRQRAQNFFLQRYSLGDAAVLIINHH